GQQDHSLWIHSSKGQSGLAQRTLAHRLFGRQVGQYCNSFLTGSSSSAQVIASQICCSQFGLNSTKKKSIGVKRKTIQNKPWKTLWTTVSFRDNGLLMDGTFNRFTKHHSTIHSCNRNTLGTATVIQLNLHSCVCQSTLYNVKI